MWTNAHWNDDIFWALKGSLGAFGIVTHVKAPTISVRKLYAGVTSHASEYALLLFGALHTCTVHASQNPAQHCYVGIRWSEAKRAGSYHAHLLNTEHQKRNEALDAFMQIPAQGSSLRSMLPGECAREVAKTSLPGLRRYKFTFTAKSSTKTIEVIHDLIRSYTAGLHFAGDSHDQLLITYEPLTIPHLQASQPQSNIFDLSYADAPLLIIAVEFSWQDKSRDEYFESSARQLRKAMRQKLLNMRALHKFIFTLPTLHETKTYSRDCHTVHERYSEGSEKEIRPR